MSSGRDVEPSGGPISNRAVKRNVFPRQEAPAPWAAAAFHPGDVSCASFVESCQATCPEFKSSHFLSVPGDVSLRDNFHTLRAEGCFFFVFFSNIISFMPRETGNLRNILVTYICLLLVVQAVIEVNMQKFHSLPCKMCSLLPGFCSGGEKNSPTEQPSTIFLRIFLRFIARFVFKP